MPFLTKNFGTNPVFFTKIDIFGHFLGKKVTEKSKIRDQKIVLCTNMCTNCAFYVHGPLFQHLYKFAQIVHKCAQIVHFSVFSSKLNEKTRHACRILSFFVFEILRTFHLVPIIKCCLSKKIEQFLSPKIGQKSVIFGVFWDTKSIKKHIKCNLCTICAHFVTLI